MARGRALDISVSVGLCLVRQSVAFMVGGARVREHLRDGPALPRRKESAGSNGECENCEMSCLNFELSAERYQLKKYDKYFF